MIRFTTPTFDVYVRGQDLTGSRVQFTIRQQSKEVTKDTQDGEDIELSYDGADTRLQVYFTQQETGSFREGTAEVQVNWEVGGRRLATIVKTVNVGRQLLQKVVV